MKKHSFDTFNNLVIDTKFCIARTRIFGRNEGIIEKNHEGFQPSDRFETFYLSDCGTMHLCNRNPSRAFAMSFVHPRCAVFLLESDINGARSVWRGLIAVSSLYPYTRVHSRRQVARRCSFPTKRSLFEALKQFLFFRNISFFPFNFQRWILLHLFVTI